MSPVPTMSVRCAPEHQQLIRSVARALRERPEFADSLAAMLAQPDATLASLASPSPSDALASALARLDVVERWIDERASDLTRDGTPPATTSPVRAAAARKVVAPPKQAAGEQDAAVGVADVGAGGVADVGAGGVADVGAGGTPLQHVDAPLWLKAGRGRKLSEYGKRVMVEMKKSGARSKEIAVLFGCEPQNVARLLWRQTK